MRISGSTTTQLLEAAEAIGVRREELLSPLGLDPSLAESRKGVEWEIFVAILDRLAERLDNDPERLRAVGRALVRVPSYAFFQKITRTLVSPRALYEVGRRWVQPANFPHIHLEHEYLSETRMRARSSIPEPHAGCAAIYHIFEGHLTEIPSLLGLPRATIVSSVVTTRSRRSSSNDASSRTVWRRSSARPTSCGCSSIACRTS